MRPPNEESDLQLVHELVFAPRGIRTERFTNAELVAGRTPDFRLLEGDKLAAYCEVKSPRDEWLDDLLDTALPGELVGGTRRDPVFNRIARHIAKAATQFEAVNRDPVVPNILVFVNHDEQSKFGDLVEVLTGEFRAANGQRYPTMKDISEGRIGVSKHKIDLYVWLEARTKEMKHFCGSTPGRVSAACTLLGFQ